MQQKIVRCVAATLLSFSLSAVLVAEDAASPARTRPEMKRRIEALKERTSRLPLPELTEEQRASGIRSVNNGRLRSIYLPESWQTQRPGNSSRSTQSQGQSVSALLAGLAKQPDYAFKTRLFWIVSRTNDCQYCLGHQELKLRRAGMTEDQIAALDSKWSMFPPDEQAAMAVTRKITLTPHLVSDDDLAALKGVYRDAQIIDILQTVAGYNSTNRWTASTGIPQDKSFGGESAELNTPTSEAFTAVESKVAPLDYRPRPAWEPRSAAEAAMKACESRTSLVTLPSAETARKVVAADSPGTEPPTWFRALCGNPQSALQRWKQRQAFARDGRLEPVVRAQIAWVCAREDRAWYAAAHAQARLEALGMDTDAIWEIGQPGVGATSAESAVLAFTKKLTSSPHLVTDADIAGLRELLSDHEVAEVIALVCEANSFDRWTEMLRLPLEGGLTSVASRE